MYAILNEKNICVILSSTKDGYTNFVETNLDVLGRQYIDGRWVDVQSEPTLTETEQNPPPNRPYPKPNRRF